MKYERGDVVRLVSRRPYHWNSYGRMDMFLNTIQVVSNVKTNGNLEFINPLTSPWAFKPIDIAQYIETVREDAIRLLQDAQEKFPVGTKFLSAMSGKRFTSKGLLYPKVENGYVNILDAGENYIYYRGKYADFRDVLKFGSHTVKVTRDGDIAVGCKTIDVDDLNFMVDVCNHYNITSLTVDNSLAVPATELSKWLRLANR